MVTVEAHLWEHVVLAVSPGVGWEEHEGEIKSIYAAHVEAATLFETSHCLIGPVVGYSKTEDDVHYTVGVHIGVPL